MSIDFDKYIDREATSSVKFDARKQVFGTEDVFPMWVADMDFAVPDEVTNALQERARHPIFGYSLYPDSLYQALIEWFDDHHQWKIQREWILMAPGVVPSLFALVQAFVGEGEGVIVQSPVYFPFFSAVTTNRRKLIDNPLKFSNGRYEMDFEHLELCAKSGARMLLLCSPHNPVGRVWRQEELLRLLDICKRYQVLVVSDDIHCDLVYPGAKHLMLAGLADANNQVITAVAPSKTFNIPGLGLSALIVQDAEHRKKILSVFESLHLGNTNPFSIVAFEAGYRYGAEWLSSLLGYLNDTCQYACDFIKREVPLIRVTRPEATYLLWLDCRALGLTDKGLRDFFIKDCHLGLSPGSIFGNEGQGFMRMNIATSRRNVIDALLKLKRAVEELAS